MRRRLALGTGMAMMGIAMALSGTGATAATDPYTVQTVHFPVLVGPNDDQPCDIIGDVYLPSDASAANPMPAVLTTNGFGGSKDDQAGTADTLARRGYVVLSYSGLGFGGSTCAVTLDDPDWDGKAASQLVTWLAEREEVQLDGPGDPRIGLTGGSYGGGFQFAAAKVDPRIDTLIPQITWNDLSYSLAPNNTDQFAGVSTTTPGAAKFLWAGGFSVYGAISDLQNMTPGVDTIGCPNFPAWVCPALITATTTGYLQPGDIDHLRHASVATYLDDINVPVLLIQGEWDTLFNLNEAIATYDALKARDVPVKMVWRYGGHTLDNAPGEFSADPAQGYLTQMTIDWFDHYLKDGSDPQIPGPEFEYFRDWVPYDGHSGPAYAQADSYPVGAPQTWRLSDGLTTESAGQCSQQFLTTAAGLPTALNEADILSPTVPLPISDVVTEAPGTFASWSSGALTDPVEVVGSPIATLRVEAPVAAATQGLDHATKLVLFLKVVDIDEAGVAHTINRIEAPVRIPDVTQPFTVTIPAMAHRFEAGHSIGFMVSGGSINYRGNNVAQPVTIACGDDQTLSLPVVGRAATVVPPVGTPPGPGTPATPQTPAVGPAAAPASGPTQPATVPDVPTFIASGR